MSKPLKYEDADTQERLYHALSSSPPSTAQMQVLASVLDFVFNRCDNYSTNGRIRMINDVWPIVVVTGTGREYVMMVVMTMVMISVLESKLYKYFGQDLNASHSILTFVINTGQYVLVSQPTTVKMFIDTFVSRAMLSTLPPCSIPWYYSIISSVIPRVALFEHKYGSDMHSVVFLLNALVITPLDTPQIIACKTKVIVSTCQTLSASVPTSEPLCKILSASDVRQGLYDAYVCRVPLTYKSIATPVYLASCICCFPSESFDYVVQTMTSIGASKSSLPLILVTFQLITRTGDNTASDLMSNISYPPLSDVILANLVDTVVTRLVCKNTTKSIPTAIEWQLLQMCFDNKLIDISPYLSMLIDICTGGIKEWSVAMCCLSCCTSALSIHGPSYLLDMLLTRLTSSFGDVDNKDRASLLLASCRRLCTEEAYSFLGPAREKMAPDSHVSRDHDGDAIKIIRRFIKIEKTAPGSPPSPSPADNLDKHLSDICNQRYNTIEIPIKLSYVPMSDDVCDGGGDVIMIRTRLIMIH